MAASTDRKRKRDDDDKHSERPAKLIWARYYAAPYTIPFVSEEQRTAPPSRPTTRLANSLNNTGTNTARPTKTQRSATSRQLIPPTDSLPPLDKSIFRRIPNEIVDCIIKALHPVDASCFALTSKENYQAVKEATGKIPRELCPRDRTYFVCHLTIKSTASSASWLIVYVANIISGRGDYRALLRQLALWLPFDDMVYCLNDTWAGRPKDLLKRDRIWKKRFFKDLARVRIAMAASMRRLDKAQGHGAKGGRRSAQQREALRPSLPSATAEQEWKDLIAKSEATASKGRVLRFRE